VLHHVRDPGKPVSASTNAQSPWDTTPVSITLVGDTGEQLQDFFTKLYKHELPPWEALREAQPALLAQAGRRLFLGCS
jgi:hypothetical protein